jgi:hypothetical protein
MAIQFETEAGSTVFLPELPTHGLDPEKARQAIALDRNIRRSHLFPLMDAVARFACSQLLAPQGCPAFDLPRDPWIITIGDDLHFAWGPKAFPAESLDAAIKAASHGIVITSGPDPFPYRVAATVAVRDRKNALIIETLPHQREAWKKRIEFVRGADELPMTWCLAMPSQAGVA